MPVTIKAKRAVREKALNKSLKKQERNVRLAGKRIKRIKRELLDLQIDRLKDEKWLSELTWQDTGYFGYYEAYAITSKEVIDKHNVAGKVSSWYYDNKEEKDDYLELKRDGNKVLGITKRLINDDAWDEWKIIIFAVDTDDLRNGNETEIIAKDMLKTFAEKMGIEVDING